MSNNHIVVDLNKVQYAYFYYENQYGDKSRTIKKHSVHGVSYNPTALSFAKNGLTMEEVAVKEKFKDVWYPILRLQLTANHSLVFRGEKAKSIWKEWTKRIFKKGK